MKRLAVAILLAFAIAPLAAAQSPAGAWSFKTDELSDTCTMSGDMTIKETGKNQYSCTFKALQSCRRVDGLKAIHTDQSCIATMADKKLTITSKLQRVTKVDPFWLAAGMDKRYAPDNFIVTIKPSGDEMTGMFESMGEAPVTFRRQQDLVS
jgi:hypothetical protein